LPFYNDLSPSDLPYEFLVLHDWTNFFIDSEEAMGYLKEVPRPPKVILYTPEKFYRWVDKAREYMRRNDKNDGNIMAFGDVIETEDDYYRTWGI
jgi:hypothetical protein